MKRRYFSPHPLAESQPALLAGPEAHHLLHVVRIRLGEQVVLFDGSGGEHTAEATRLGRAEVEFLVGPREETSRELPHAVYLGVPAPKADRQRGLVEKAVELGITALTPLVTAHSDALSAHAVAKWSRYVVEASKQCGRNRLMHIDSPMPWPDWLKYNPTGATRAQRYVAHPGGAPIGALRGQRSPGPALLSVGPEAGFSPHEAAEAVAAGWQIVDLGPRILRMETAVAVLAALAALER